jgi:hypothetical protein
VLHTKNVLKSLDESIKNDKNRIKSIFNELMDTINMSNDVLLGRDVGPSFGDPNKNNLDKRLLGYAKSAIIRPNSRSSGVSAA